MIEKQYREIEFGWGNDLGECIERLTRNPNSLLKGTFNGHTFYSDTVTMDSAYLEVMGMTKAEKEENGRKWRADYKKEKEEYLTSIPKLTEEYKVKGRAILTKNYYALWDKMVPIRLGDLYEGMELTSCLDIIKELPDLDKAKEVFEEQGHSGMSGSLVLSMVKELCSNGNEFVEYVKEKRGE
jgi:hypothetical protein